MMILYHVIVSACAHSRLIYCLQGEEPVLYEPLQYPSLQFRHYIKCEGLCNQQAVELRRNSAKFGLLISQLLFKPTGAMHLRGYLKHCIMINESLRGANP